MPATQADSALEYVLFGLRILLAIALYAFLAVLLWALLRERSSEKTAHSPTAWLEEDTPDQLADNHRYVLRSGTWIGRDPSCPVCVNDELVSERHAYIGWRADEQAWYIEDNFSKNGTFVNGQRIQPDQQVPIYNEYKIQLGTTTILVFREGSGDDDRTRPEIRR